MKEVKIGKQVSSETMSALESAIRIAEGRATARTITAQDIIDTIDKVQNHLEFLSGIKKDMVGTIFTADINQQRFPRAYKYTPESTHFSAYLARDGWRVSEISREACRNRAAGTGISIRLTEATKAKLQYKLSEI